MDDSLQQGSVEPSNSRNRTLIMNGIESLNQIPKNQSNFIEIQVQINFSIFIQNPMSFGQSANNKSCSKCHLLSLEKTSYFSIKLSYFS
jgi:hypothetical protein